MGTRQFAPLHPHDLTLDEAVILDQIAGITPDELIASCQITEGVPPATHLGALLFLAARREDPDVKPEDVGTGMSWTEAINTAAEILLAGAREYAAKSQPGGDAGGISARELIDQVLVDQPELAERLRAYAEMPPSAIRDDPDDGPAGVPARV